MAAVKYGLFFHIDQHIPDLYYSQHEARVDRIALQDDLKQFDFMRAWTPVRVVYDTVTVQWASTLYTNKNYINAGSCALKKHLGKSEGEYYFRLLLWFDSCQAVNKI